MCAVLRQVMTGKQRHARIRLESTWPLAAQSQILAEPNCYDSTVLLAALQPAAEPHLLSVLDAEPAAVTEEVLQSVQQVLPPAHQVGM
jgi:hypothetical protein